jgi:hypothetical protein
MKEEAPHNRIPCGTFFVRKSSTGLIFMIHQNVLFFRVGYVYFRYQELTYNV